MALVVPLSALNKFLVCWRALSVEPLRDYLAALEAMRERGYRGLAEASIAFVLAWFAYVPLHELMHAWGCLLAGGDVSRLEIAPEYGGALLARVFPFVASGSHYAGQLTGFDTHGNDAIYLVTVLAPFLLTIFAGVPLVKRLARPLAHPAAAPWLVGAALPFAYAPFVSLLGDYYEAGSIVVSRAVHALDPGIPVARWRGDDVLKLVHELAGSGANAFDWIGVGTSLALGIVLALLTYHAGGWIEALRRRHG